MEVRELPVLEGPAVFLERDPVPVACHEGLVAFLEDPAAFGC